MNIIPTVSVIIPTYNRERTIKRAIDSVLSQTFKDFELLVMDDGSNDNTKDIINSFYDTRINYYYNKNSGGPAHPRNLGLNKSKGKLIAFLDSDDWWHPKKLEFSLQEINKGNDVVYHDLYYVTSIKQKLFFRKDKSRTFGKNIFEDLIINGNGIPNSSIVLYKKLLKSVGGFNESKNYISWEDYDCWIKISKISSKFSRINKTLGYYWFDGNNITTPYRINARVNEIEKKYLSKLSITVYPAWMIHQKGIALLWDKKYEQALKYFLKAFKSYKSIKKKITLFILIIIVFFKQNLRN